MANEQNQLPQTLDTDIPAAPATAEDGGLSVSEGPQSPPASEPVAQDTTEDGVPQKWQDDKRAAIFAAARERRKAEQIGTFNGDMSDPQSQFGQYGQPNDPTAQGEEDTGEPAAPPAAPQAQAQPAQRPINGNDPDLLSRRVRTVVNGVETEISVEEAIRNYQQAEAAGQYLTQAKQILQQTKEFQRNAADPRRFAGDASEQTGQEFTEPEYVPNSMRDDTSRAKTFDAQALAEKIQLGRPEEVMEALEAIVSSKLSNANPAADYNRVLTVLEDQNAQQAIQTFAAANPEIHDPMLQDIATKFIHRGMAEDLLKSGMSMEELRQKAVTPDALKELHKHARIQRLPSVRSTEQLLTASFKAAQDWRRGTNQPGAPSQQQSRQPNQVVPSMQQRIARKEDLQQQPAARRLAPALTQPSSPKSVDDARTSAIRKMREQRGLAV